MILEKMSENGFYFRVLQYYIGEAAEHNDHQNGATDVYRTSLIECPKDGRAELEAPGLAPCSSVITFHHPRKAVRDY